MRLGEGLDHGHDQQVADRLQVEASWETNNNSLGEETSTRILKRMWRIAEALEDQLTSSK